MFKIVAGVSLGGTAFAGSAYYVYVKNSARQTFSVSDAHRMQQFNDIAQSYDRKTRSQEFLLGIGRRRRQLIAQYANGDVLEVGAGTGRNIGLFDPTKVTSVTLCDQSEAMVAKMKQTLSETRQKKVEGLKHTFIPCDANALPFSNHSYDTVFDMFGLCSYTDPIKALQEMDRVCKPGGTIVLFEHGRGNRTWINEYLDKFAPGHAQKWGCWWNREIRRTVRLAGLVPTEKEAYHFGTTHVLIVKKPKLQS